MPATNKKSVFVKTDISGIDGLQAVLDQLPEEVRGPIITDMIREGAKPAVEAIKEFTTVRYGNLKKSITAVVRKKGNRVYAVVGPSTEYFQGGKKLKKGASKQGAERPALYAHLVEFGWTAQNGRNVSAKPFMRPGLRKARPKIGANMAVGLSKGLQKSIKKIAKYSQ